MIHDKNSIDYHINKAELEDMEIYVPMTLRERTAIRSWVKRGNTIESNPWEYRDSSGELMNYLQAYRIRFGYIRGPWDYWHGEEMCSCPDNNYDYWDELKERRYNKYRAH